jgi:hypothetical protein
MISMQKVIQPITIHRKMSRPGAQPPQSTPTGVGAATTPLTGSGNQVQQPTARQVTAAQSVAASRDLADEILSSLVEFENRAKIFFDRMYENLLLYFPFFSLWDRIWIAPPIYSDV